MKNFNQQLWWNHNRGIHNRTLYEIKDKENVIAYFKSRKRADKCQQYFEDLEINEIQIIYDALNVFLGGWHNKRGIIFTDEFPYDENWAMLEKIMFDKSPYIFMIFTGS